MAAAYRGSHLHRVAGQLGVRVLRHRAGQQPAPRTARSMAAQLSRVPALISRSAPQERSACRSPGQYKPPPPGTPRRTSSVSLTYLLLTTHASTVQGRSSAAVQALRPTCGGQLSGDSHDNVPELASPTARSVHAVASALNAAPCASVGSQLCGHCGNRGTHQTGAGQRPRAGGRDRGGGPRGARNAEFAAGR